MKNFPITVESGELKGQTFWVSRAACVCGCVFTMLNGKWCVLANKRGAGTPDFQGYWNMPCGYVDFDESIHDAVIREVYEETGVRVNPNFMQFWKFIDSPKENRQNITFRYYALIDDPQPGKISVGTGNDRGGEEDEVEAIGWIPVSAIDNYKWAFGHDKVIKEFVEWMCLTDEDTDFEMEELESE